MYSTQELTLSHGHDRRRKGRKRVFGSDFSLHPVNTRRTGRPPAADPAPLSGARTPVPFRAQDPGARPVLPLRAQRPPEPASCCPLPAGWLNCYPSRELHLSGILEVHRINLVSVVSLTEFP